MVKSQQTNPFIRSISIRIYYTTASNDSIDVFSSGYFGYCWHKGYCTRIVRSLSTILYLLTKYYSTSWQRQHPRTIPVSKRFNYLQISHNFIICKRLLWNSTHIWQNSLWQLLISHMISYHRARLSLSLRYTYNNRTDFL